MDLTEHEPAPAESEVARPGHHPGRVPDPGAAECAGPGGGWLGRELELPAGFIRPPATTSSIRRPRWCRGVLPTWPSGTGPLFIWPGLSNPPSDLIQTTGVAWGDNASACGAKAGQWCLEASVFGSFGQRSGPSVSVDPDDHITIEYQLGSDNNTWTQTVTSMKLGEGGVDADEHQRADAGGGFGFATEADADSYTIDTQYYLCTEIHLAAADTWPSAKRASVASAPRWARPAPVPASAPSRTFTRQTTASTWLADLITLPAMNPSGWALVPTYSCGTGGTARHFGDGRQHRHRRQRWAPAAATAPARAPPPGRAAASGTRWQHRGWQRGQGRQHGHRRQHRHRRQRGEGRRHRRERRHRRKHRHRRQRRHGWRARHGRRRGHGRHQPRIWRQRGARNRGDAG